jgi:hypothetical protein
VKTLSVALKAHIAQAVTTLALCWRIVRTDGQIFGYTSLDADLLISGVTYSSTAGFSRSAITTGSTGQVDNLEVVGFLSETGITKADVENGLFDYAAIHLFGVNWADLTQGTIKLRRGWMGEVSVTPSGAVLAELRGMTQALVQEFGNVWSPLCRADLGDSKCKVPIKPAAWHASTAYASGTYVQALTQADDAHRVAIFLSAGGTSGSSEPTWDTTIGNTTSDGTITWTSKQYYRGISSVASSAAQNQFVAAAALSAPAVVGLVTNTAAIGFADNVSGGTTVTISDGVNSVGWTPDGRSARLR